MEIQGTHFLLRKIKEDDRFELARIADNKKIWLNLRDIFPHPYTLEDADFFINMLMSENPQYNFAIEFESKFAGMIGLLPKEDIYRKTAEIGYWLGEPYWGKGIMREACQLLTNYGLYTLDFIRLQTGVFDGNIASMKILEKCSYEKDGVFKKSIIKDGVVFDEHRYSIVR